MRIAHLALDLGLRNERGNRIDDHHIHAVRTDKRLENFERLVPGNRLEFARTALRARDDYRDLFTALVPQLPQIDLILTDISAVSFDEDRAEYQMIRVDGGVRLSYFILFVRDADGLWRLKFF